MTLKVKLSEAIIGGISGLTLYFIEMNWTLVIVWVVLIALDILSGVVKGIYLEWNSTKFKNGLLYKAYEIILVGAALLIDLVLSEMNIGFPLGYGLVGVFALKDFLSIMENGYAIGFPIPQFLQDYVKKADDSLNKEGSEFDEDRS